MFTQQKHLLIIAGVFFFGQWSEIDHYVQHLSNSDIAHFTINAGPMSDLVFIQQIIFDSLLDFSFYGNGHKVTVMFDIYLIQLLEIFRSMQEQGLMLYSYSKSLCDHCWIFLFWGSHQKMTVMSDSYLIQTLLIFFSMLDQRLML